MSKSATKAELAKSDARAEADEPDSRTKYKKSESREKLRTTMTFIALMSTAAALYFGYGYPVKESSPPASTSSVGSPVAEAGRDVYQTTYVINGTSSAAPLPSEVGVPPESIAPDVLPERVDEAVDVLVAPPRASGSAGRTSTSLVNVQERFDVEEAGFTKLSDVTIGVDRINLSMDGKVYASVRVNVPGAPPVDWNPSRINGAMNFEYQGFRYELIATEMSLQERRVSFLLREIGVR